MKRAFSFIELVIVIIIIGVLAAFIMPKFAKNELRLTADQILSHLLYTQSLAMSDDKFEESDDEWFKGRWAIYFNAVDKNQTYTVYSDKLSNRGNYNGSPDGNETALNPLDQNKHLSIGHSKDKKSFKPSEELNLSKKYGIKEINLKDCKNAENNPTPGKTIFFDEIGRPYVGDIANDLASNTLKMLSSTCQIVLTHESGKTCSIIIEPISGFAQIDAENCGR